MGLEQEEGFNEFRGRNNKAVLISIFGLGSVQKIVLNQYKLSILALFTFKFPNFQSLFY